MQHDLDKGQHFLTDETILQRIADVVSLNSADVAVEVGSGPGTLTKHLVARTNQLICVEIDSRFDKPPGCKQFINANVLDVLPELSYSVLVGNIPYHISEPLLRSILKQRPREVVLLTGELFASRLIGETALGYLTRNVYVVTVLFSVPPEQFSPPPRVTSAVVHLQQKKDYNPFLYALAVSHTSKVQNALLSVTQTVLTKNEIRQRLRVFGDLAKKPVYQLRDDELLAICTVIQNW